MAKVSPNQGNQCTWPGCKKILKRSSDIKRHIENVHRKLRPWACTYPNCIKAFAQRSAMITHLNVHTHHQPYHCEFCNMVFSDRSSRGRHEEEIHKGRLYKCQVCSEGFKRKNLLVAHISSHIDEEDEDGQEMSNKKTTRRGGRRSSTAKSHYRRYSNSDDDGYNSHNVNPSRARLNSRSMAPSTSFIRRRRSSTLSIPRRRSSRLSKIDPSQPSTHPSLPHTRSITKALVDPETIPEQPYGTLSSTSHGVRRRLDESIPEHGFAALYPASNKTRRRVNALSPEVLQDGPLVDDHDHPLPRIRESRRNAFIVVPSPISPHDTFGGHFVFDNTDREAESERPARGDDPGMEQPWHNRLGPSSGIDLKGKSKGKMKAEPSRLQDNETPEFMMVDTPAEVQAQIFGSFPYDPTSSPSLPSLSTPSPVSLRYPTMNQFLPSPRPSPYRSEGQFGSAAIAYNPDLRQGIFDSPTFSLLPETSMDVDEPRPIPPALTSSPTQQPPLDYPGESEEASSWASWVPPSLTDRKVSLSELLKPSAFTAQDDPHFHG